MSEMATSLEMRPATLKPFGQSIAGLPEPTDCYTGGLTSTSDYLSPTPREWRSTPEAGFFHDHVPIDRAVPRSRLACCSSTMTRR